MRQRRLSIEISTMQLSEAEVLAAALLRIHQRDTDLSEALSMALL
jgi:hypothetical protein